ncbi:MAG: hypothetical protein AAF711_19865 [Planctomycetota bacterium]
MRHALVNAKPGRYGISGLFILLCCLLIGIPAAAQEEAARAEPEAETEQPVGRLSDDQAAFVSELASAQRFEAELQELLKPNGQLDTTREDDAFNRLVSLATRCGIMANSAMHDEARLVLLGYQARALAALASLEPELPEQNINRLQQLVEVARQIDDLDLPGARATADYWSLIADVAGLATAQDSAAQRQAFAELAFHSFIEKHAEDEHAAEFVLDTRLSLAHLLDRRGAQAEAGEQLKLIGKLPNDSPRLQEAKQLSDSIDRLGAPVNIALISTELIEWRSSDHVGRPVLVHVYSDGVDASIRMIDVISRSIVEGKLSGIAVVSLRVGDPVANAAAPLWPTLPVQLEPNGVLDQLGITALPTLAWLDEKGRLASIGTTSAVLNQLDSIRPERPEQPGELPQPGEQAEAPAAGSEAQKHQADEDEAEPQQESEPAELGENGAEEK